MRMYLISDNHDTLIGFRLVGIDGIIVHHENEFKSVLNKVLNDNSIGILLVMEQHAKKFSGLINNIRLTKKLPLIVEIPDRHGSIRNNNFITDYIKNAIGVKLN